MLDAKYYFKKAGGFSLIKQYFSNGVLGTAIALFLLIGRSRTALELLKLSVTLKIKQKLSRRYIKELDVFNGDWNDCLPSIERRTVWLFWWQGETEMPKLVKRCLESARQYFHAWDVVLLTKSNYQDYVEFPNFITEKFKKKQITLTHFSDLLRLELLIKYGGLWLDATVLCTSSNVPESILKSELFVYRPQKPGADGMAITMSSWLMWAKTNSKILIATQNLLYKYWEKNNSLCDYYLLHHLMSIVMDYYEEEAKHIPPFCNSDPHILLLHLFDKFDEQYWEDLKKMTCFHKLSYKINEEDVYKKGTYYDKLINDKQI